MKKKILKGERISNLSFQDLSILESFHEIMMDALVREFGHEIKVYVDEEPELSMSLYVFGALYGEEHPELSRVEIVGRTRDFQMMTRALVKDILQPSLKTFDQHYEIYTQIFVQGIYLGQVNGVSE